MQDVCISIVGTETVPDFAHRKLVSDRAEEEGSYGSKELD
jgi:hypothetical protein